MQLRLGRAGQRRRRILHVHRLRFLLGGFEPNGGLASASATATNNRCDGCTVGTFLNSGPTNATTANYAWLSQKTGRPIMAETSFAPAGVNDRWTTTTAANINARIGEGVIGVLVNAPGGNYQTTISGFASQLNPVCQ